MSIVRNGPGCVGMFFAIAAGSVAWATSTVAVARYDGMWSISIITEKGDCDRGYRYPIRIANGVLANAGAAGFTIIGKLARSGAITVTMSNGHKSATGSGRLVGNSGTGSWTGGACSGTWTAERRSS